ncbi:MAG: preprotein translocase subunit SecE [Candidatus Sungbacteria bacterium]|uniref:Protein translocase subunit SecE n=1 Tax=Candidatus Sungiibacteriota bacterium TaxID=2750080 RepID=A0A932VSE8_9BACT|nr:preprotein translocase subunit SecE [Candidatus Sungbacteria bacterium]
MPTRIATFLQETHSELKKVRWPTREQTIQYTMAVIVVGGIMGIFLGGLDFVFQFILNRFLL